MSLEKIVKDIAYFEEFANQDPNEFDPRGRIGIETRIRESKDMLLKLQKQYATMLPTATIGVFVTGTKDKLDQFLTESNKIAKTVLLDSQELYKKLTQDVWVTFGENATNKEFRASQFQKLMFGIKTIGDELGLLRIPLPPNPPTTVVNTFDELFDHVKGLVCSSSGNELNFLYLKKKLIENALALRCDASFPVVVWNATEAERIDLSRLFQKGLTEANLDEVEVTPEYVLDVYKMLKKKVKSSKKDKETENV